MPNEPAITPDEQPTQPNTDPGQEQNLQPDREINPGQLNENTEVDLDKTRINTYQDDNEQSQPTRH